MSDSSERHMGEAAAQVARNPIGCAVLTVSDTRTAGSDHGGPLIGDLLGEAGHPVRDRAIVRDEPAAIEHRLAGWLADPDIRAVLTTGGTGIARRDTTIDVVRGLIDVEIDGFGELFRMLSWEEVGSAAMMSRAVAGLVIRPRAQGGDTFIFSMPGSTNAITTAMRRLIVPQLAHLAWERRDRAPGPSPAPDEPARDA